MVKRMLMDATHPEETRVVVLDGTRLDEFDVETSTKKQIKGNIYLAKVVRVEPSLQAAFVDYGGNRHGFLAFSEIHPDYYQIPVADRERLLAEVHRHEEEEHHAEAASPENAPASVDAGYPTEGARPEHDGAEHAAHDHVHGHDHEHGEHDHADHDHADHDHADHDHAEVPLAFIPPAITGEAVSESSDSVEEASFDTHAAEGEAAAEADDVPPHEGHVEEVAAPEEAPSEITTNADHVPSETRTVETVGGDEVDEDAASGDAQRRRFVASRHYKIQEVIKRRQIMLVQVVKEERGTKGAALTTYLSLAGRYCVLMPNSARGGGVSRKITSAQDRRRLKQIVGDLELPKNMAVILRTAGADRNKAEIKRDYEYLQRTWNLIREVTMNSRAPALIHEEASLIKRAIRDIYSRDIEEVWVEGEEGYKVAKDFMKTLTPSHAKKVQRYKDDIIPLFHRYQVETQMESINSPVVQLRSGGSIVFAQTEALVAIDVNSGRATKERHIEETAYKTNMEAAEEIARQLRLRDLAGLVVIDFIDMEDNRNNHAVERKLKESLKVDRARIQVGRISHFGLLELSRQRLRPSLIEANFRVCHHCAGTGMIRSTESAAVHSLRMLEEEGVRRRSSEVTITVHPDVALYLLNYKREMLASIEGRYGLKIFVLGDPTLIPPNLRLDRVKAMRSGEEGEGREGVREIAREPEREALPPPTPVADDTEDEDESEEPANETREPREHREHRDQQARDQGREGEKEGGGRRRRRRRRRRGGGEFRDDQGQGRDQGRDQNRPEQRADQPREPRVYQGAEGDLPGVEAVLANEEGGEPRESQGGQDGGQGQGGRDEHGRRRRRGRRGGRRRRRGGEFQGDRHGEQAGDHQGDNQDGYRGADGGTQHGEPHSAHHGGFDQGEHSPAAQPIEHREAPAPAPRAYEPVAEAAPEPRNDDRGPSRFFRAIKEWGRGGAFEESAEPVREAAPRAPAPEPEPDPNEPPGPKRGGWWQQGQK